MILSNHESSEAKFYVTILQIFFDIKTKKLPKFASFAIAVIFSTSLTINEALLSSRSSILTKKGMRHNALSDYQPFAGIGDAHFDVILIDDRCDSNVTVDPLC
uniref:Uncharacterized protein n=1 Tax=Clytia hemisphaerica TaxID=252671 RepID=A0A7M5XL85_9CNID|eukprot:TCONS_00070223-protein